MTVAAAAGGTLYLAFAPSRMWWLAIVAFALLFAAIRGCRGRSGFWLGVIFASAFNIPLLFWSGVYVGTFPWIALSLAMALLTGPGVLLMTWAIRHLPWWPVFAAAGWVAGELLRTVLPFGGFPWGTVAFSQPDGPLLAAASMIGAHGVSFLVVVAGAGVHLLVRALWAARRIWRRPAVVLRLLAGPALLLVGVLAAGLLGRLTVYTPADTAPLTHQVVAVIQGNVPKPGLDFNDKRRAVTDNHARRTHELAAAVRAGSAPQPDLVIWPENASDIDPYRNADAYQVISAAVDDIKVPVLVGAVVAADQPRRNYNMGILWLPGSGPEQTYTKRHPVPFGEYMPARGFFRLFSDKVDLLKSEFLPGDRVGTFTHGGTTFGDLICFEVVDEGLAKDVVDGGAQFLVVQTNNATFGWTHETYQQQAMSRVRAVQFGREVLIAATSGVSAVIRPDGSVESRVPMFTPGYLVPSVPLISSRTPGTVLSAPIGYLLTVAVPLALLVVELRRRRVARSAAPSPAEQSEQTDTIHLDPAQLEQKEPTA